MTKPVDRVFLGITVALLVVGTFSFVSASLGVLARDAGKFYGILFNQLVLGLGGGILSLWIVSKIKYQFWRKYSFYFFLGAIFLAVLVFAPGLGFEHSGARRWISLGAFSFQPAEILKFFFVVYFAAWLSWVKRKEQNLKFGALPLIIMLGLTATILLKQPDTKSLLLIFIAGFSMLFVSGLKWQHLILSILIFAVALGALVFFKPYVADRFQTYLNPSRDPTGSSYQLQQSLIAIGSGGLLGRGWGQSIQKFNYLPEPQGDSIFAVIGEEFGFVGGLIIIFLYLSFSLRGLRVASRAPTLFSRLLVTGLVIMLASQSFLNIASIIGVLPLTGVPLVFISHGGTSLLMSLIAVGVILNVSRFQKIV